MLATSARRDVFLKPHPVPMWDLLVESLEEAKEALAKGKRANAAGELENASSLVTDLYGDLDPTRTIVTTHLQALLETCLVRIEHARRHADIASIDATLQLLRPVRAALSPVRD